MSAITKTVPVDSVETAVEWIKILNLQINKKERGVMVTNMDGREHDVAWITSVRALTQKEWEHVLTTITRYELPVEIGLSYFSWMLGVYGHTPSPEFTPDRILLLDPKQIPIPGTRKIGREEKFLESLAWLTHSARNKELLEWYGLKQPREPSYYTY